MNKKLLIYAGAAIGAFLIYQYRQSHLPVNGTNFVPNPNWANGTYNPLAGYNSPVGAIVL